MVSKNVTYVCSGRPAAACPGLGGYGSMLLEASGDLLDDGHTGFVGLVSLPFLWRWWHQRCRGSAGGHGLCFCGGTGSGPDGS